MVTSSRFYCPMLTSRNNLSPDETTTCKATLTSTYIQFSSRLDSEHSNLGGLSAVTETSPPSWSWVGRKTAVVSSPAAVVSSPPPSVSTLQPFIMFVTCFRLSLDQGFPFSRRFPAADGDVNTGVNLLCYGRFRNNCCELLYLKSVMCDNYLLSNEIACII